MEAESRNESRDAGNVALLVRIGIVLRVLYAATGTPDFFALPLMNGANAESS